MVAHIAQHALDMPIQPQQMKQAWLRLRRERIPCYLRARIKQQAAQPRALEPRMAGQKDPLPPVKCKRIHTGGRGRFVRIVCRAHACHLIQGALPEAISVSRYCLSRMVSMHCQNPPY